jgi:hypothetical protein
MEDYTIAITTFSKRYNLLVDLIQQIRSFNKKTKILLMINGEKDGDFDNKYRLMILKLCAGFENIYPNFFIETRGVAKLWNSAIILSASENLLILNDDLELKMPNLFSDVETHLKSKEFSGLTKINNSFSHFIINKSIIDSVGYFDERLIGFGEEDGDITYRFIKNKIHINNIHVNGIVNIISNIRHDHIESGIGKYSKFNRDFIYGSKYKPSKNSIIKGMFDVFMDQILEDKPQYPYEKFFRENKIKL